MFHVEQLRYSGGQVKSEEVKGRLPVIFPPKITPLVRKSDCVVMGSTGGGHDADTAHGRRDGP
jgi:hypothetical protein